MRVPPFVVAAAAVHVIAIGLVIVRPHLWPAGVAAVAATHILIVVASVLPRCALLGTNIRRVPPDRARSGIIALTFDDGPDPEITPAILEMLEAAGATATFFCIGRKAEQDPSIVAAIRKRGHDVQNHSQTHPNLFALHGPRKMRQEIGAAQQAIERVSGVRPRFFRAPAGIQNVWLFPLLNAAGLTLVSWTRRGFDTVDRHSARVASRLVRNLRAGDILLLHDGSSARDEHGRAVVLDALAIVLRVMAEKELRSDRLSALV